jgi:hypothetical protein
VEIMGIMELGRSESSDAIMGMGGSPLTTSSEILGVMGGYQMAEPFPKIRT